MGKTTAISWCHHTFNAWWGCVECGPECDHCYARTFDKRVGGKNWGKDAPRRFFGEKHWAEPLKWAKAAAMAGQRRRVFCSSMADVFEDRADLEPEREKLWELIRQTASIESSGHPVGEFFAYSAPERAAALRIESIRVGTWGLDWLLLTKRPQNILKMCPPDVVPLIWAGATVGVKKSVWRIAELVRVQARIRFLSVEPQLEALDLNPWLTGWSGRESRLPPPLSTQLEQLPDLNRIDWVIQGGESGPKARPFDLAWARDLRRQCKAGGVAYFLKQLGAAPTVGYYEDWAREWFEGGGFEWPAPIDWSERDGQPGLDARVNVRCMDRAGANPSEWPAEFRVQEMPR